MDKYPIAIFRNHSEFLFEYRIVTCLTRVSETFILQCEREELITSHVMRHGAKGLSLAAVNKLKLIEDMGLSLDAVDFVLRYRDRIKSLERELDEMEQSFVKMSRNTKLPGSLSTLVTDIRRKLVLQAPSRDYHGGLPAGTAGGKPEQLTR